MPKPTFFVDSHFHYFPLKEGKHRWLSEPSGEERFLGDLTPMRQDYLPENYLADSSDFPIGKTVHVQGEWDHQDNVLAEVNWLMALNDPLLGAIIPYVNLLDEDIDTKLELLARQPLVKGIRQIIAWHETEYYRSCEEDFLQNPKWCRNFSLLSKYDLRFDLQIFPEQTDSIVSLLEANPSIAVVVEHLLQPREHDAKAFQYWEEQVAKLAALAQTCMKLSGAGLFVRNPKKEDIAFMLETAIKHFGPQRCMFGSNFPVEKLYFTYEECLSQVKAAAEKFGEEAESNIFNETATRFYQL